VKKLCCFFVSTTALVVTGCGGSLSGSLPSGGSTNVTLLATSTANGRFAEYGINFTSITLTNKAGKTVSLLSQPQGAEFIHLNGTSEPLLTANIPQDVYTSASITFSVAGFEAVYLDPTTGGPAIEQYVYENYMPSPPTVNLPDSGLTIGGANMALSEFARFAVGYPSQQHVHHIHNHSHVRIRSAEYSGAAHQRLQRNS
jgi:hypothetical protein